MMRTAITYASRDAWLQVPIRFADGKRAIQIRTVDADLGTINRITPATGRWFAEIDDTALAPTLVVNEAFLHSLVESGRPGHVEVRVLQSTGAVRHIRFGGDPKALLRTWPLRYRYGSGG